MATKITSKALQDLNVSTPDLAPAAVTNPKLADGAVDGRVLGDGVVDDNHVQSLSGSKLDNNSIPNSKYADDSVDGRVIAAGSVGTEHVSSLDGSVLVTSSVLGPAIGPAQIGSGHYAPGSVNSLALGPASVVTATIAGAAVTYPKLQTGTPNSLLMHGASGVVEALPVGQESSIMAVANGKPTWVASVIPTGIIGDFYGYGAPSGWLVARGGTIGNAASGANTLASDAAYSLYMHLWANFPDSLNPVLGGRGASALSDWNANKRITLPDLCGRVTAGIEKTSEDNTGDPDSGAFLDTGRITAATASIGATVVGATGGFEQITLSSTQIPPHTHSVSLQHLNSSGEAGAGKLATGNESAEGIIPTFNTGSTGGNLSGTTDAHNNMPPFMLVSKIIKL